MRLLGFVYRFVTNLAFLATVYLSLNYIEKYDNRAILAIAILIYAGMRASIAVRSSRAGSPLGVFPLSEIACAYRSSWRVSAVLTHPGLTAFPVRPRGASDPWTTAIVGRRRGS